MRFVSALLFLAALLAPVLSQAAAFTPGDILIYRIGDGTTSLVNSGSVVFLDEYSPAGMLVQSINVTAAAGGSFVASGTATSEGLLNLSPNGQFLTFTGYNATTTTSGGMSIKNFAVPRTIGLVTANGAIDVSTNLTDYALGDNPRGAVTMDGLSFYAVGGTGGVRFANIGTTTSTRLDSSTYASLKDISIFGGQLYVSNDGSTLRLGTVGSGVPTTVSQPITSLPGLPTSGKNAFDQFFFADLSPTVPGVDTLYVADEGGTGVTSSILKYGLSGSTWVLEGSVTGVNTDPFHGLTGSVFGTTVTLFATTVGTGAATGGGSLYTITDSSGQSGSLSLSSKTLLATAPTNESFRGVSLVPIPEPSALVALVAGVAALGARRSRPRRA